MSAVLDILHGPPPRVDVEPRRAILQDFAETVDQRVTERTGLDSEVRVGFLDQQRTT